MQVLFHVFKNHRKFLQRNFRLQMMQHLDKPAHMSAFILVRQIDIHIYGGDRMLKSIATIAHRYRVPQVFDADLINRNIAVIALILCVFHPQ